MIVGLTGGIGSGKTTVANIFRSLNIPVFIADEEAKILMNTSRRLQKKIITLLGEDAYANGVPDRAFIAKQVFNDSVLLEKLNELIHPAVRNRFAKWYKKQKSPYVIQEAAILFESGGYRLCDAVILVTAPLQIRLTRVMERDRTTMSEVLDRVKNQWPDEDKIPLSDYVITNMELKNTEEQVNAVHDLLLKKSKHS